MLDDLCGESLPFGTADLASVCVPLVSSSSGLDGDLDCSKTVAKLTHYRARECPRGGHVRSGSE